MTNTASAIARRAYAFGFAAEYVRLAAPIANFDDPAPFFMDENSDEVYTKDYRIARSDMGLGFYVLNADYTQVPGTFAFPTFTEAFDYIELRLNGEVLHDPR
jgi:hypothetical protein